MKVVEITERQRQGIRIIDLELVDITEDVRIHIPDLTIRIKVKEGVEDPVDGFNRDRFKLGAIWQLVLTENTD